MERKLVLDGRMLTYELERKQVKNINLRIRPDGSIYVSAPRRMPESMIEAFLESKAEFIFNAAERAGKRRREIPAGEMLVLGCEVEDGFDSERKRDAWLKEQCVEAVSRAFARLYPIFERRGVPLPEIRFRRMKSRWGSCQPVRGVLTFNSALIHVVNIGKLRYGKVCLLDDRRHAECKVYRSLHKHGDQLIGGAAAYMEMHIWVFLLENRTLRQQHGIQR